MPFDRDTRSRLARMVTRARELLQDDVSEQLRRLGFQGDGSVLDLDRIQGLAEDSRVAGQELRELLDHFLEQETGEGSVRRRAAYQRMAREIGFTTFNRLVALRMAEERGVIVESVGKGFASPSFQIYERVASGALGGRADTYRAYIESLFDELALDLPALFDRTTPESRIFPSEETLEQIFGLVNEPELAPLWKEDEAIGWVYQYYNDPEERRAMRKSRAPRNSRELAVRNQFFTPRYVVEFLSDNTLGRIWWEMTQGQTALDNVCSFLVRRKHPIFQPEGQRDLEPFCATAEWRLPEGMGEMWTRPNPALDQMQDVWQYALTVEGYRYASDLLGLDCADLANQRLDSYRENGKWEGGFEELRCCLFYEQRRWRHFGSDPQGQDLDDLLALHQAVCQRWGVEADVVAYRKKKDPRDINILDPACGSGHFLLYCFDLLETIYDEAYHDPDLGPPLQTEFPDHSEFQQAIPGLILEHNLHGLEIDGRACQITGLALWLRAQRAYQRLELKPEKRPIITRGNIVCAQPMPGAKDMLERYLNGVDERLRPLVRSIWEKMLIAGEAGALLKIEEETEHTLEQARKQVGVDIPPARISIFDGKPEPVQTRMAVSSQEERDFWRTAHRRLALIGRDYLSTTDSQKTRRRLFADDAAQGLDFIRVCRQTFDVVLMNPPFGEPSAPSKNYIDQTYPRTKNDVYAAFVERWMSKLEVRGRLGAITSRTGFFLSSFRRWREEVLLEDARLVTFADLGHGVMDDAMVEAAAYALERV